MGLSASCVWHREGWSPRPVRPERHVLAVAILLGAGVLSGCTSATAGSRSSATACNATSVADHDLPSVVTIAVSGTAGASTGSGEIIEENGSILTNNHVVSPAANGGTISVVLSDGRTYPGTIKGRDPLTDLAVVRIDSGESIACNRAGIVEVGADRPAGGRARCAARPVEHRDDGHRRARWTGRSRCPLTTDRPPR